MDDMERIIEWGKIVRYKINVVSFYIILLMYTYHMQPYHLFHSKVLLMIEGKNIKQRLMQNRILIFYQSHFHKAILYLGYTLNSAQH